MKTILHLSLCILAVPSFAEEPSPAATKDRVEFPTNYATTYQVLRTVARDEGKKLVTVYGNAKAASVTNSAQLPYPYGSIIVMETASIATNRQSKPVQKPVGTFRKDQVLGLHVMRREKGFGEAYGTKRSGEWEFVEYRADGSYITPPQKSATCAECHIKAGAAKDFVYNGRFAAEKK